MKVLVSGSHGLVGGALCRRLDDDGHTVVPLVRGPAPAGGTGVRWDPGRGDLDAEALRANGPYDAVVHLAGAGIGARRWSTATGARSSTAGCGAPDCWPTRWPDSTGAAGVRLGASAVGYYGDRGAEQLTEGSPTGEGFLAEVCQRLGGGHGAGRGGRHPRRPSPHGDRARPPRRCPGQAAAPVPPGPGRPAGPGAST